MKSLWVPTRRQAYASRQRPDKTDIDKGWLADVRDLPQGALGLVWSSSIQECCPTKGEEMIMKNHKGVNATPTLATRRHCVECVGSAHEVNTCGGHRLLATDKPCPHFPYRHGERRVPLKVIRQECLTCSGSPCLVERCPSVGCNLHPYRLRKNPAIIVSDEIRARKAVILEKARNNVKERLTYCKNRLNFAEIG